MAHKICFVASSGGHLEEILKLKEIEEENESFLITEKSGFQGLNFNKKVYFVKQINRKEKLFILKFTGLFFSAVSILRKEKPDCIISTGALATYPVCLIGKLMRKHIIYIESFARVDTPSMTGKLMYHIADLFIVQWEEMLQFYPKAICGGGIF